MSQISTTKLILLAILGFIALSIGSVVLTLQLYVAQRRQKLRIPVTTNKLTTKDAPTAEALIEAAAGAISDEGEIETEDTKATGTIQSTDFPTLDDLHLASKYPPPAGSSWKTTGEAYWKQAASFLKDWDAMMLSDDDSFPIPPKEAYLHSSSSSQPSADHDPKGDNGGAAPGSGAYPRFALEQAANAGHPLAQYYLANAHASGIWPMEAADPLTQGELHVFDEWIPTGHGDHPQVTKSYVLWHMAAMAGNMEAAMALAFRLEPHTDHDSTCEDVLPYYEAAAHGVMDELENSLHSRGKVLPPMDRHTLAQVHMHGGTSSQLDWNNKPDESKEALQFYHLKATTIPWSAKLKAASGGAGSSGNDEPLIDVHAAYTLAQLYHYGLRGVPQNLTKSLEYYEIAATNGSAESAGQAGTFHLWGIGTPQNLEDALYFFRLGGAAYGFDGCRQRHEQNLLRNRNTDGDVDVFECDDQSLNGFGLLHLLGGLDEIEVDLEMAEKYFSLAKEMGNTDAMYNLGMMWLGWKTHFKRTDDLQDDGFSGYGTDNAFGESKSSKVASNENDNTKGKKDFALHVSHDDSDRMFKGPLQSEIQDSIKLISAAANKGHLQAKHRMAMLYSQGVRIQTAALKYDSVKRDCPKAKAAYSWIVENGSLSRSRRLRQAYKAYIAGDFNRSLRNYLAAAETGSSIGQVNAAFLFEQGTCLGLSNIDCAKAAVRLWKAAAARGHTEACLRVGDFYYYGRLRGRTLPVGPFGWVQYLLYPEQFIPPLVIQALSWSKEQFRLYMTGEDNTEGLVGTEGQGETTCAAPNCEQEDKKSVDDEKTALDDDLAMAVHYYQVAAETHRSSRANFNLGFMHEWGLGLKQDFPLAKRHYDLAATSGKEATLAVQIALMAMNTHEFLVKLQVAIETWWQRGRGGSVTRRITPKTKETSQATGQPRPAESDVGQPVPRMKETKGKAKTDIILSHLFDFSSLTIIILGFIVLQLMELRRRRRQR